MESNRTHIYARRRLEKTFRRSGIHGRLLLVYRRMKAAVLRELGKPVTLEELTLPRLGKGQVLLRMQQAAICHSQRLEVSGARGADKFFPPLIGHEAVGILLEVGPRRTKVKPRSPLLLSSIRASRDPP